MDDEYSIVCVLTLYTTSIWIFFFFLFTVKLCATLSFTSASIISINLERRIYELIMQNDPSDWHQPFMLLSVAFDCNIHFF